MSAGYIRRFTTRWPRPIAVLSAPEGRWKNNFGRREGLEISPLWHGYCTEMAASLALWFVSSLRA